MIIKKLFKYGITTAIILWTVGYAMFVFNVYNKASITDTYETDALIVLTGGQNRIDTALTIFDKSKTDKLFITGVHKDVSKEDILQMWDGKTPLKKCCITLGQRAKTTRGNALETQEWLKEQQSIKTITLITSAYHMDRALLEFKHALKNRDVSITTHPVIDNSNTPKSLPFWKLTFSEYNKLIFRTVVLTLENKG